MAEIGQIRDVNRKSQTIMKVIGPLDGERIDKNGKATKFDMYMLTNEFPRHHYIVITDIVDSLTEPGNKFYVAHLITHSSMYNNLKVTEKMYYKDTTKIDLTESYITRDKFLIEFNDIKTEEVFGNFDLQVLEKKMEY